MKKIIKPGRNCWRVRHADRVSFLVDGESYFSALNEVIPKAEEQLLILSWDIYSKLRLAPPQDADKLEQSPTLIELINDTARRATDLHAHILNWDFSLIFMMDRELLPIYQLDFKSHPRVNFQMDDQYPVGASHHQKVVVVDDEIAFSGGLDLTRWRWDSPRHDAYDERRRLADGSELPVQPYHDIQMAVDGEAARALGDLARERWYRATGESLSPVNSSRSSPWPQDLKIDLKDVDVAISRTQPEFSDYAQIREVETLHLDSIRAAEDYIYIENQYFTSARVAEALAERLREENGPEIVLVLPLETAGWLSQGSMDMMRVRLIGELREADKHNRFAVYFPQKADLPDMSINLHAKLMIMDDRFVRVGSANLNNRSMGLDTECDLAVELKDSDHDNRVAVRSFRDRLLAEHLDVGEDALSEQAEKGNGLIESIESLRGKQRTLAPLEPSLKRPDEKTLNDIQFADPEKPLNTRELLMHFIPEETSIPASRRVLVWIGALVALLALAAAWRFTPLGDWLNVDLFTQVATRWQDSYLAPLIVIGAFMLGGLLVMPVTVLIVAAALAFGSVAGFFYSLAGAVASALLTYAIGASLGKHAIRKLAGSRINKISRQLATRGILTMSMVRIVPVAPFTIINLVAGASHIRFRDYLFGTILGMTPGIAGVILVTDRVTASFVSPDVETIISLVVVAAIVFTTGYFLSRKLVGKTRRNLQQDKVKTDHAKTD
ncbi:MAG: VTT domain-containing protein [Gammaproteobacteria bacterium]|nr:VTT domain-containing protein [Gammaproteobacteria bacterium]